MKACLQLNCNSIPEKINLLQTIAPFHLCRTIHIWYMPSHQRTCSLTPVLDHQDPFQPFYNDTFRYYYIWLYKLLTQHHLTQHLDYVMNATHYWLFASKYSIWNAAVAALQFWTADLEPHILSNTIEWVHCILLYYLHAPAMQPT